MWQSCALWQSSNENNVSDINEQGYLLTEGGKPMDAYI